MLGSDVVEGATSVQPDKLCPSLCALEAYDDVVDAAIRTAVKAAFALMAPAAGAIPAREGLVCISRACVSLGYDVGAPVSRESKRQRRASGRLARIRIGGRMRVIPKNSVHT